VRGARSCELTIARVRIIATDPRAAREQGRLIDAMFAPRGATC